MADEVTTEEFVAAGLCDPEEPDRSGRLPLLRHCVAHGATLPELSEAFREEGVAGLLNWVSDRNFCPATPLLPISDAASDLGVSVEDAQRYLTWLSLDRFSTTLPEGLLGALAATRAGEEVFGRPAMEQFSRVMVTSIEQILDAGVSIFVREHERPAFVPGTDELEHALLNERGTAMVGLLPDAIATLMRYVFLANARRNRRAHMLARDTDRGAPVQRAVGFVDLVGYTPLAEQLRPSELAAALERFERAAWELARRHEARLVKFVGDEVMFIAATTDEAVAVATGLCDAVAQDDVLGSARGAVAHGPVMLRAGDAYGPTVNLAARGLGAAPPGSTVVVGTAVRDLRRSWLLGDAEEVLLKGFVDTHPVATVRQRQDPHSV